MIKILFLCHGDICIQFHDRRIACKNRCFHIFNMFAVKQRLSDNISQRKIRLCRKFGCRHRTMYGPYCGGPVPFHWQSRRCPVLPISIRSLLEAPLLIFNESKHRLKKTMPVCISSLLYIFFVMMTRGDGLFKSFCCFQNNIHDIVITQSSIQRQMVIGGSAPYLSCIIMIIICSAAFLLENQILGFFLCQIFFAHPYHKNYSQACRPESVRVRFHRCRTVGRW